MSRYAYLEADGTVIEVLTADVSLVDVQNTKHASATTKIDGCPDTVIPKRNGPSQTQYHKKTSGDGTLQIVFQKNEVATDFPKEGISLRYEFQVTAAGDYDDEENLN